ncbi:MAG: DUF3253 domain-containing protein [Gracilimonas sp.]
MKKSKQEIRNRILTFTKQRRSERSVSSSEVTRNLFSDIWRDHLDNVKAMSGKFKNKKLIKTTQKTDDIRIDKEKGAIRLSIFKKDE